MDSYIGADVANTADAALGAGAPAAPQGDGFSRFQSVLRAIVPAIAAASAYKNKTLGNFTEGYQANQELQRRTRADEMEQRLRAQSFGLQQQEFSQRIQDTLARAAAQQEQAKLAQETRERGLITSALQPFESNPLYAEGIPASVADGAVIDVPGIGRLSLKEALGRVGSAEQDGKYLYGKPAKPEKTPLITTRGPDGKPIRGEDKPGAAVYERPRAGAAPKEPKTPSVKVKRDLVEGQIVTFTDPMQGVSQDFTRDEIKSLLKQGGRPSDDATVDKVIRSPQALVELLK